MEQEQEFEFKNIRLIIGVILVVAILILTGYVILRNQTYQVLKQAQINATTPSLAPSVFLSPTQSAAPLISYPGVAGRDALSLLKESATIEQDASGLVSGINGVRADSAKREFWAFYVNGKLADMGPADYKTKDGDNIEWKIEEY